MLLDEVCGGKFSLYSSFYLIALKSIFHWGILVITVLLRQAHSFKSWMELCLFIIVIFSLHIHCVLNENINLYFKNKISTKFASTLATKFELNPFCHSNLDM